MWSLIQGDKSDEERDDPQSKRSGLIEVEDEDLIDALDEALEVGGWVWDEGGILVRAFSLMKWRKKEKKCKGVVYICFGICEGVVIEMEERGFCVKGEAWGVTWPIMAGQVEG